MKLIFENWHSYLNKELPAECNYRDGQNILAEEKELLAERKYNFGGWLRGRNVSFQPLASLGAVAQFKASVENLKQIYLEDPRFIKNLTLNILALMRGVQASKVVSEKLDLTNLSLTSAPAGMSSADRFGARKASNAIEDWIREFLNNIENELPLIYFDIREENIVVHYKNMEEPQAAFIIKKTKDKLKPRSTIGAFTLTKVIPSIVLKSGHGAEANLAEVTHEIVHYIDHQLPLISILKQSIKNKKSLNSIFKYLKKRRHKVKDGHIETGKLTFLSQSNVIKAMYGSSQRRKAKGGQEKYMIGAGAKDPIEAYVREKKIQLYLRKKFPREYKSVGVTVQMVEHLCSYGARRALSGHYDLAAFFKFFNRYVCKGGKHQQAAAGFTRVAKETSITDPAAIADPGLGRSPVQRPVGTMVAEQQKLDKGD